MKLSAIIFLIVALLASIAFSVPNNYKHCKDILKFHEPMDGDIYFINSTQPVEFEIFKDCYDYDKDIKVSFEVFSVKQNKVVDTIIEQVNLYELPQRIIFLIDKVWANDNAKYFIIATFFKGYDSEIVSKSGVFTTVNKKSKKYY
ncbi:hypothetical protein C1645_824005 [Glomus cerebriforme]|uniref:Uncharacterized protein n=1 Tax=Glomus cerebriforme TaxID=658196 RepID=A0A397T4C5_9GLOM|nr:hypothetical protein C1645_824005 [Glomus cerebriforme]